MALSCQLQVQRGQVQVLVHRSQQDMLKARLPSNPLHPRALLTLLEGIALWQGQPLRAVIVADASCPQWQDSALFGDELWPGESQLVRFEVEARGRPMRLRGVGDFRSLRRGA